MKNLRFSLITVLLLLGYCSSASAQAKLAKCSQPLVLKIGIVNNQIRYDLKGKVWNSYPLDAVADEMGDCWPDRPLFIVATWDVPLYAFTTPGKLQLNKVRYFIKGRDEHIYTEIAYGRMFPNLPVTSDITPFPEDDGTLHPPTKIQSTKGIK
jgi:hypothetical protein